jgi:hypothetical protein
LDSFPAQKGDPAWKQLIQGIRFTRRGFLELSSAALATAGLLGDANAANATPVAGNAVDPAKPDSAPITGKIALEEHFVLPETADTSYAIEGFSSFFSR